MSEQTKTVLDVPDEVKADVLKLAGWQKVAGESQLWFEPVGLGPYRPLDDAFEVQVRRNRLALMTPSPAAAGYPFAENPPATTDEEVINRLLDERKTITAGFLALWERASLDFRFAVENHELDKETLERANPRHPENVAHVLAVREALAIVEGKQ